MGARFAACLSPSRAFAMALALTAGSLMCGSTRADMRSISGASLALTLTTDQDTTIETDPNLQRGVRVVAESADCLESGNSGGAIIITTASCGSSMGTLTIMVPPAFPITLMLTGSGNVRAGELLGPLHATLTSDGDLNVRRAAVLQLAIRGSGDATVQDVFGPADIQVDGSGTVKLSHMAGSLRYSQHGSGDLSIARIDGPSAQLDSSGSGDIAIAGGNVGALQVRVHGSGDFTMAGTVATADLEASGGGDIRVPHVSGPVQRNSSGGSSIVVGDNESVPGNSADAQRLGNADAISAYARQATRDALRKLSDSESDAAEQAQEDQRSHSTFHREAGGFSHLIAGVLVLGLLFAVWRTIVRNGGFAKIRNRFSGSAPPAPPTHPGVIALCELLNSLERRLAKVEMHVTSKEFDLNRKFREIDAGPTH